MECDNTSGRIEDCRLFTIVEDRKCGLERPLPVEVMNEDGRTHDPTTE